MQRNILAPHLLIRRHFWKDTSVDFCSWAKQILAFIFIILSTLKQDKMLEFQALIPIFKSALKGLEIPAYLWFLVIANTQATT